MLRANCRLFGASCFEKCFASSGLQSSDSSCAASPNFIMIILYGAEGILSSNACLSFANLSRPFQDSKVLIRASDSSSQSSPYWQACSINLQSESSILALKWQTICGLWFDACQILGFLFSN